ncbi:hypothetical protein [Pandoraea oxalativorans]|uniref:Uncharacterized protein n=1 Tax=Pandoraea oxalativorans TaxID=573737 RepID=A0A0G3IBG2_9BURK|nr:hypothetical protein [Pandoraea oxalativorans]AKK24607.1 hypothetical protein MB84_27560 [Pandoraea oxalativorans]
MRLGPLGHTLYPYSTPSVPETFEERFRALDFRETASLENCAGLKEFLRRAITYIEQSGNGDSSEDVADFLMGIREDLPNDLDEPRTEIAADVKNILEGLLRTDRPRHSGKRQAPEKTIEILRDLDARLHGWWRQRAVQDAEAGFPSSLNLDSTLGTASTASVTETLAEWFRALTLEEAALLENCAGLKEFLPRAITYIEHSGNGDSSEVVTDFLMGIRDELPNDLDEPRTEIALDVKNILEGLLRTDRPRRPGRGQAPEKTIEILRELGAQLYCGSRQRVAPDVEASLPLPYILGSARGTMEFELRLQNLPDKQKTLIVQCEGLGDFLERATDFLLTPKYRGHNVVVAHYLMGKVKELPAQLSEPDPPISDDVKAVFKELLRTNQHWFFSWKTELPEKTCRKFEAIRNLIYLDQLDDRRTSVRAPKTTVPCFDGFETEHEKKGR